MEKDRKYREIEWADEKIKRFWNYESQFPQTYFTYQVGGPIVKKLCKYFPNAKNALDYGCGIGFLIPHLLEKGIQVSAVDISSTSIDEVNRKFCKNPLFKGAYTIDELTMKENKFDVIFSIEVIEHLNDFSLEETMRNFKLFLSNKGVGIITTPNNEDLSKYLVYCPNCETVFHKRQHVRSWSIDTLTNFVEGKGFEIVDVFATNFSLQDLLPGAKAIRLKNKTKKWIKSKIFRRTDLDPNSSDLPHLVAVFKIKN